MPYASTSELPENVRKLPDAVQRKWMHVFNFYGDDDAKAARMANGVAQKEAKDFDAGGQEVASDDELVLSAKDYQYVESYEYESRKLSQPDASYNPVGGSSTKACSNCMFFVSPARCTVVSGTIAPNGLSNEWRAVTPYEEKPTPVFIVGSDMAKDATTITQEKAVAPLSVMARLAALFGLAPKTPPTAMGPVTDTRALAVIKQSDGKMRWFARYSNAWLDRDHEILTEEAHKDYISWVDETGTFPELWLWHTGGTRIGVADWLDFSNGFAHASGLIDDGRESVVESLSTKDIGVSHGFLSLQQGKYVSRYRTYEISVLPRDRAAVETSGFNVLDATKESMMAFTEEKRKWLVEALGADAVANLEKSTESMEQQLKQLGVEYKQTEDAKTEEAVVASDGFKALAEQVATLTEGMATLAAAIGTVKATADEAKTVATKTTDESVEDAFVAKLAKALNGAGIVRPTQSASNVQGDGTKEADTREPDFFSTMIGEQLGYVVKSAGTAGVAGPGVGSESVAAVTVTASDGVQEVRD